MCKMMDSCILCPKRCGVNRNKGEIGYCRATNKLKIAKAYLHMWEEPPITGKNGSGTIFFSNCNLRCLFCQNYEIGELGYGKEIETQELAKICLDLEKKGATNINLVTPTHYVPLIIEGIKLAKKMGLKIPIVYNSSGYESKKTIKLLSDIVDVYLPDFKYYNPMVSKKYSLCSDYFEYAKEALSEMVRQKPKCIFDKNGNIISGVIVRHLIIPGNTADSKKVLKYLYDNYKNNIFYSIMNQFTPVRDCKYNELNRTLEETEYDQVIDYAWDIGIRNAFVQDDKTQSDSFIPKWDYK